MDDVSLISDFLKQKKSDKARKLIEKAYGDNIKLYFYYLGLSYCVEKNYNKAVLFLNVSKNHGYNNYLLYYNLGIAYMGKEDYVNAEQCFNKAISLNKGFVNSYINLAYISQKSGDTKKAYRIIKSALAFSDNRELSDIEKKLLKRLCV